MMYDVEVPMMADYSYDALKLESQLCFPLYACSREIIKLYTPFLDELELTYTQYVTMLALWENSSQTVKELGQKLYLDSGTLTPMLKKLEMKGFITRERSKKDERSLIVTLTEEGMKLREKALHVPYELAKECPLNQEETLQLYSLLTKMLENFKA